MLREEEWQIGSRGCVSFRCSKGSDSDDRGRREATATVVEGTSFPAVVESDGGGGKRERERGKKSLRETRERVN